MNFRKIAIGFVVAALSFTTPASFAVADFINNLPIITESGLLNGVTTGPINEYLGIPYAAPPLGSLRWTPPQSFGTWHGIFQATQFGSECPQESGLYGRPPFSENCLFLNVYTPKRQNLRYWNGSGYGLPVMVWIHGGALIGGGGDLYDPTPLVEQGNVIVVTINYRIGLLGFFAHPALDATGRPYANYGIMDNSSLSNGCSGT